MQVFLACFEWNSAVRLHDKLKNLDLLEPDEVDAEGCSFVREGLGELFSERERERQQVSASKALPSHAFKFSLNKLNSQQQKNRSRFVEEPDRGALGGRAVAAHRRCAPSLRASRGAPCGSPRCECSLLSCFHGSH